MRARIDAAIAGLPPAQRAVVIMRDVAGVRRGSNIDCIELVELTTAYLESVLTPITSPASTII